MAGRPYVTVPDDASERVGGGTRSEAAPVSQPFSTRAPHPRLTGGGADVAATSLFMAGLSVEGSYQGGGAASPLAVQHGVSVRSLLVHRVQPTARRRVVAVNGHKRSTYCTRRQPCQERRHASRRCKTLYRCKLDAHAAGYPRLTQQCRGPRRQR
jgi:hypothetical protein